MDKLLSLRNVGVIRDGRTILQSDDLHIPLTGITALIGPNGAGKTTLLRLIHGLIEPSIGQCERPFAPNESALVFHYTPMLKATVREHLTLLRDTDRTIRDEAIDEALQSVGIAHLANNPAQRLSAGERQKLCFARARLQNPKLVLLDEPTAKWISDALGGAKIIMIEQGRSTAESYLVEMIERRLGEFSAGVVAAPFYSLCDRLQGGAPLGTRVVQQALLHALKEAGWVDMGRIKSREFDTRKHIICAPELADTASKSELRRMVEETPPPSAVRLVK